MKSLDYVTDYFVQHKKLYIGISRGIANTFISALKRRISDNNRNIRKVDNNPLNDGQVTYQERKKSLQYDNDYCNEIIQLLIKFITAHGN